MASRVNPLSDLDAADLPSFEAVDGVRTQIVASPSQPLDMGRHGTGSIYFASKDPAGGLYRGVNDQRTRNKGNRCEESQVRLW